MLGAGAWRYLPRPSALVGTRWPDDADTAPLPDMRHALRVLTRMPRLRPDRAVFWVAVAAGVVSGVLGG